jgi:nitrite reductase/ring-hydroxylating ferredoxin subunit
LALKNKKITRKAFILKASKVALGYALVPVLVTKCDSIFPSENCESSELYSECAWHRARFNLEGEVIKEPNDGDVANGPLKKYLSDFSEQTLTITDPDNKDNYIIDINEFPEINMVGGYINLDGNDLDGSGFLIYRKSQDDFTVLSRECTHLGGPVSFIDPE